MVTTSKIGGIRNGNCRYNYTNLSKRKQWTVFFEKVTL